MYRCSKCGKILYVFWRVGQSSYGVPTPSELASMYGGICPRCGKPLNIKPDPLKDVKIYTKRDLPKELAKELQKLPKPL
ncbi:MAG: hypothetical protein ACXQTI_08890 [Candidatus Nezhaarchaeales archaeon]